MTDSVIDSLAVYYGGATQNFPGDVDGMYRAIWAVFHHSLSCDEKPDHQSCPKGPDSWCKYNRAHSNDEEPPKHTPKLPMDLSPFIKPVFTELSKWKLLEKCVLGATQNQNESLNNIIWSRVPKNWIWLHQNGRNCCPPGCRHLQSWFGRTHAYFSEFVWFFSTWLNC